MNIVKQLEDMFLPHFRQCAEELRGMFPSATFNVYSSSIGALTDWQGHDIGIECLLPDVPREQADNVAFSISVFHLTTLPMVMADVAWGHPSGQRVDEWTAAPVPFAAEALADLKGGLLRLAKSFESAIRQGPPAPRIS
jgi:hypothetical protein